MQRTRLLPKFVLVLLLLCAAFLLFRKLNVPDPLPASSLANRVVLDLEGARDSERLFRLPVSEGAMQLQFSLFGGQGSEGMSLYARFGAPPDPATHDAAATVTGGHAILTLPAPRSGTWYVLLRGARTSYRGVSLVASYGLRGESFRLGMHAHRLYNGGDEDGPPSTEPAFDYGIVRDWDIAHLQDAVIWKRDGSIDFSMVDRVYAGHAKHGAKVLKTFSTVPSWAARRPEEPNLKYPAWPGALSGPRDLDAYEDYVFRFVSHTRSSLWAVEGWNEPYACPGDPPEFTTMTPTELADVQKRLYRATKRVDPSILVLSPAQAYLCGIPTLLSARTSEGEPISRFFDVFAWHAYNRSAHGDAGPAYVAEIAQVRQYLAQAGLGNMPIADTEHGWLPPPKEGGEAFRMLPDAGKAQVLYDTARVARSMGLVALVWYSYDSHFLGKPMTSPALSAALQRMYLDFNHPQLATAVPKLARP